MDELLGKGFFPSELPPSFSTTEYAAQIVGNIRGLPAQFNNPPIAKLCRFSIARGSVRFRRRLALVNPIGFFAICQCIVANHAAITAKHSLSTLGKSMPTRIASRARALVPKHSRTELHRFQARDRAASRAILLTDIADFYPSLYTHCIPWVFHTKAIAKVNRSAALFGNKLDQVIRNSQDGQTMGIPIGPDTSFILAEAILSEIDAELAKRIPSVKGLRWIDEFELTFVDRTDADHAFAELQNILTEYELRLNPRKTTISDLPVEFESDWVKELRSFRIRASATGQANDLIRYFDMVSDYLAKNTNEHVVKYAIARLRGFHPHNANEELFQSLLCQAITYEPGAVREAVQVIRYAETQHGTIVDLQLWNETINAIIEQNALLGHDYEIAWCLWAALTWSLQISAAAAALISLMENSVVAILALDSENSGLFAAGGLDKTRWQARMTTSALYEEEWLLAYEANKQGWLPSLGGVDHVAADPAFGFLKAQGVSFYVPTTVAITPGALVYP